jgi:hypothetical protein
VVEVLTLEALEGVFNLIDVGLAQMKNVVCELASRPRGSAAARLLSLWDGHLLVRCQDGGYWSSECDKRKICEMKGVELSRDAWSRLFGDVRGEFRLSSPVMKVTLYILENTIHRGAGCLLVLVQFSSL